MSEEISDDVSLYDKEMSPVLSGRVVEKRVDNTIIAPIKIRITVAPIATDLYTLFTDIPGVL